jgi:quinol monooxygenase YgiN
LHSLEAGFRFESGAPERGGTPMELYIFARFHAREGEEAAVAAALRNVIVPTRSEPGCLAIDAFRSIRDPSLFYLHSRWIDEAAFDIHAELPHTVAFLQRVEPRVDHPLEVTRTTLLAGADREI